MITARKGSKYSFISFVHKGNWGRKNSVFLRPNQDYVSKLSHHSQNPLWI